MGCQVTEEDKSLRNGTTGAHPGREHNVPPYFHLLHRRCERHALVAKPRWITRHGAAQEKGESMNETIEVKASSGSLSNNNPPDTGPTAPATTEPHQQPPMQNLSPVRTQPNEAQVLPSRKERKLATGRQGANSATTTDSGEVHLFLCHRLPAAQEPSQLSSTYVGRFRNVEAAIDHASPASIRADIVLIIPNALLAEQPDPHQGEAGQTKNERAEVQTTASANQK